MSQYTNYLSIATVLQYVPFNEIVINTAKYVLTGILKSGSIPQHVSFIMDGNRRYAKMNQLELFEGHEAGSVSLMRIIEACYDLGIKHASIYAFSIENFNRSNEEITKLFELLVDKLCKLEDEKYDYSKFLQIRIIGNKSLIPKETLERLERVEENSKTNVGGLVLNINFCYTSRDEIAHSVSKTVSDVIDQNITINQISSEVINDNFYFYPDTPPVDLLVRTSGHTRLSDYLIWHVNESNSRIEFLNIYWPDFTEFDFYSILLKMSYEKMMKKGTQKVRTLAGYKDSHLPNYIWDYENYKVDDKRVELKSLKEHPPFVSILGEKL
ncbi:hypothetical protein WICPIJ_005421 [Wickerhamomyces pijperi]|uniref:Alkyl transferase n=1 Tax=Wickerhamomyces pijperi TaxID=599730 RepID=A0A9P8Q644_WICPI|nr:hypothetical protein WICPIJ_005421 [Wickerhamomyces pijperi]